MIGHNHRGCRSPHPPLPVRARARWFGLALFLAGFLVGSLLPVRGATSALIVTGLAGTPEHEEEFHLFATEAKRLLVERGVPAAEITVLDRNPTRAAVLEALESRKGLTADDEFWLLLIGHTGRTQGGVPAFQLSGPRLAANDLAAALDAIPARQLVLVATGGSGAFLKPLQNPRRSVVTATKDAKESDFPRFAKAWLEAFSDNPKASFVLIAAKAAGLVDADYLRTGLAQTEHARLADPVTGTILEPPFGADVTAAAAPADGSPAAPARLLSASEIKVEIKKPDAEWESQPATPETLQRIKEARATPNPDGHSAIVLRQELQFTVEKDRTTDQRIFRRVWIAKDDGVDDWANAFFPQSPPLLTTKLEVARVIHPDGSATVFNPAKLPACTDPAAGCGARSMVFLPGVTAGCVIEIGYRTREMLNATLPHVSVVLPLAQDAPALATSLEIRVPERPAHSVALKNLNATPEESSEHGRRVLRCTLGTLPALEPLPGDPPSPLWAPYAAISSLPSWEAFAEWYRRLAEGSDEVDATVKAMAAQLAEGKTSRLEKIRSAYEFVSALRYVANEIGVRGFRPRTPAEVLSSRFGDCKDKANLLIGLLGAMDIDASLALLNRGQATDVSFPSWQFNHAIAFVPKKPADGQPDDLWLDATDGVTPFGSLPPGDYGRDALVLDKERADFRKVAGSGPLLSTVHDTWDVRPEASGSAGTLRRVATGAAGDTLRREYRDLSPAQRGARLAMLLEALWPGADFAGGSVTATEDLKGDATLEVRFTSANGLPGSGGAGLEAFLLPTRTRPLWLNDGQPLSYRQTLHLASAAPHPLPPALKKDVAGSALSVRWEEAAGGGATRDAEVSLPQPIVSASDYPNLRAAVRQWSAALAD